MALGFNPKCPQLYVSPQAKVAIITTFPEAALMELWLTNYLFNQSLISHFMSSPKSGKVGTLGTPNDNQISELARNVLVTS